MAQNTKTPSCPTFTSAAPQAKALGQRGEDARAHSILNPKTQGAQILGERPAAIAKVVSPFAAGLKSAFGALAQNTSGMRQDHHQSAESMDPKAHSSLRDASRVAEPGALPFLLRDRDISK